VIEQETDQLQRQVGVHRIIDVAVGLVVAADQFTDLRRRGVADLGARVAQRVAVVHQHGRKVLRTEVLVLVVAHHHHHVEPSRGDADGQFVEGRIRPLELRCARAHVEFGDD
jgi:hypothetical protein